MQLANVSSSIFVAKPHIFFYLLNVGTCRHVRQTPNSKSAGGRTTVRPYIALYIICRHKTQQSGCVKTGDAARRMGCLISRTRRLRFPHAETVFAAREKFHAEHCASNSLIFTDTSSCCALTFQLFNFLTFPLPRHDVVHHGVDLAVGVLDVVPDNVPEERGVLLTVDAGGHTDHLAFHRQLLADGV